MAPMEPLHLGANVQDKEEYDELGFFIFREFPFTCGEEIYKFPTPTSQVAIYKGICANAKPDPSVGQEYPKRCVKCNNEKRRWERRRDWNKRIQKRFCERCHSFIKFVTVGLPGQKFFDPSIDRRKELVTKFKRLRNTEFWKKYIDGGMWFYEETSSERLHGLQNQKTLDNSSAFFESNITLHINPHLHILLLSTKKIPYDQLQEEAAKVGLGKFKFSSPRNKNGSYSKPSVKNALWYLLSYLKKDTQIDARCRGTFGCLYGDNKHKCV